jgi:MarR family transcriptional regulator, organic hydroperoxide resistance regulator
MTNEVRGADWQLLAQVSQVFRSLSDSFMDQVDMHRAQAILLCTLKAQDGMSQTEIAEQLSVQGATITNMLQRMEEANLVLRRRDPDDNRLVRVYLTDAGREKEQAISEQFQQLEAKIFEGMTEEDQKTLRRLLMHLLGNMNVRF